MATMVPRRSPALALVALLLLAGCLGGLIGGDEATPTPIEPQVVGASSSGGQCVESPSHDLDVIGRQSDGVMRVDVDGNAIVPGAHFVIDEMAVNRTGATSFRLDVNTTTAPDKPERECPNGGVVPFHVTVELPATEPFALEIRVDGETVGTLG